MIKKVLLCVAIMFIILITLSRFITVHIPTYIEIPGTDIIIEYTEAGEYGYIYAGNWYSLGDTEVGHPLRFMQSFHEGADRIKDRFPELLFV